MLGIAILLSVVLAVALAMALASVWLAHGDLRLERERRRRVSDGENAALLMAIRYGCMLDAIAAEKLDDCDAQEGGGQSEQSHSQVH